jgi:hypothetical protein
MPPIKASRLAGPFLILAYCCSKKCDGYERKEHLPIEDCLSH